jgi:hypothetical protein
MIRVAVFLTLVLAGCQAKPRGGSTDEEVMAALNREAAKAQARDEMEACVQTAVDAENQHIRINGGKLRDGVWTAKTSVFAQARQIKQTRLEVCRMLHPAPAGTIGQPP